MDWMEEQAHVFLVVVIGYTTYPGADQRQHDAFIKRQSLALFHFDAFLVQAFHGVHFSRVGFTTTVNFAEAAASNDSMDAKVVHRQLCTVTNRFNKIYENKNHHPHNHNGNTN